jgi:hypothetical protein
MRPCSLIPFARSFCFGTLAFALLAACPLLQAQNNATTVPSPSDSAALILKWVETEKALSAEQAEWLVQRSEFRQLIDLYTKEIQDLSALVEAAGEHALESEQRRAALVRERDDLQNTRSLLAARLAPLEQRLLRLLPALPAPLLNEISAQRARMEEADRDRSNQDRVRDLLAILVETDKFQQGVHVDREIREFEQDVRAEVTVVYLGLAAAFYVDESGRRAGTGKPTLDGWTWSPNPSIASTVRQAVSIIEETQQLARFLTLPLSIDAEKSPESADSSP